MTCIEKWRNYVSAKVNIIPTDNVILNRNNADGYSNEALNGREGNYSRNSLLLCFFTLLTC